MMRINEKSPLTRLDKKSPLAPLFQRGEFPLQALLHFQRGELPLQAHSSQKRGVSLSVPPFEKGGLGGILRGGDLKGGNLSRTPAGFTLLEILIAMFIFAILALLLSSALHNVIGIQSRSEQNAERLHDVQLALLVLSRDITQAVNRPITVANGRDEAAFIGKPTSFSLTHAGVSNAQGRALRSGLQRVRYFVDGKTLWRNTWTVLDQAPQSAPLKRTFLKELESASFEYLDSKNVFHPEWPAQGVSEILPRAVRINLAINRWGKLSQLYVISAEPIITTASQSAKLKETADE